LPLNLDLSKNLNDMNISRKNRYGLSKVQPLTQLPTAGKLHAWNFGFSNWIAWCSCVMPGHLVCS